MARAELSVNLTKEPLGAASTEESRLGAMLV